MTVIEELVQAKADLASMDASVKAGVALVEAANKERDEIKAQLSAIEIKSAEELKKVSDVLAAEQVAHVSTKTDLEKAKKVLANPAFAAAASKTSDVPLAEGGSAETVIKTKADCIAEHKKITDPIAQARYRRDNAKELGLA